MSTRTRGFASMDKDALRDLSRRAARRSQDLGRAHVWNVAEASAAGKKSAERRRQLRAAAKNALPPEGAS